MSVLNLTFLSWFVIYHFHNIFLFLPSNKFCEFEYGSNLNKTWFFNIEDTRFHRIYRSEVEQYKVILCFNFSWFPINMPVFHTKTIESILDPVAQQVTQIILFTGYISVIIWIINKRDLIEVIGVENLEPWETDRNSLW